MGARDQLDSLDHFTDQAGTPDGRVIAAAIATLARAVCDLTDVVARLVPPEPDLSLECYAGVAGCPVVTEHHHPTPRTTS